MTCYLQLFVAIFWLRVEDETKKLIDHTYLRLPINVRALITNQNGAFLFIVSAVHFKKKKSINGLQIILKLKYSFELYKSWSSTTGLF